MDQPASKVEDKLNPFCPTDLISSVVIGEISAWLILLLANGFFPSEIYDKYFGLMLIALPILFPIICVVCLFASFLISKKVILLYQISKFILVGGLNTLLDWGILALASGIWRNYYGVSSDRVFMDTSLFIVRYYTLFKGMSFIIAASNSYTWNKFWVFARKRNGRRRKGFLEFFLISLVGLLINGSVASFVFGKLTKAVLFSEGQCGILSAVLATIISMAWNLAGYKLIVFELKEALNSQKVVQVNSGIRF